jgi:hypothetical protein
MTDLPKPPKKPCGSCPYRRDVPSGIWDVAEYAKLPAYDGEVIDQLRNDGAALFMCHQNDGCLCGGWLDCHGADNLAALRLHKVDPSVARYQGDVPVFASGSDAAKHGLKDIERPGPAAMKMMAGLIRKRERKEDHVDPE